MIPIIPQKGNEWQSTMQMPVQFPPNLLASPAATRELQQKIVRWIHEKYAWPQVLERAPFEPMWDTILEMYRIRMEKVELSIEEASKAGQKQITSQDDASTGTQVRVADSVVFDAVERCTCIHHFVAWKEGSPIQFNIPDYYNTAKEDAFYHPLKDKINSMNGLLRWNIDNEDVYRKHEIITRHFYTYGIGFATSEFQYLMRESMKMNNQGQATKVPEFIKLGTSFDPISIRRLFLNYRLMAADMDYQPCPFWFTETPRFATLQNVYDPTTNPFGFVNLDQMADMKSGINWLYSDPEMVSLRSAIEAMIGLPQHKQLNNVTPMLLQPAYSVDAIWTYYPVLPLDPDTLEFETRADGSPVPMVRYVYQAYGQNLAGKQIPLRLQRNFYPRDSIPLYGTNHMPDMDSGLYTPSLGYLLWNHYKEIVTCKNQYIANKDWINNPPAWVQVGSPAVNQDLTKAGVKIEVNGPQDFGWRVPYDATASTIGMITLLREQAKDSTKSNDAILGKALGGRTSATEANNAFQASMSAITTPINLFNYDIMGGFATRVWDYTASWFPPALLSLITGQMGTPIKSEDLWLHVSLKWDIGSTFVESIVRQQNIRYVLESSMGDPSIKRAAMWRELLTLWKFDANEWVDDGGFEKQVYIANNQAIKTFMGQRVFINPDQNHQIAIKVKTGYLEDTDSEFMSNPIYNRFAPEIIKQLQLHQQFLMVQMHLQMLQQQAIAHGAPMDGQLPAAPPSQAPPLPGGTPASSPGQFVQQGGVALS